MTSSDDQPDMQVHQFWVEVPDCIPCLEVPSQGYGPECIYFCFVLLKIPSSDQSICVLGCLFEFLKILLMSIILPISDSLCNSVHTILMGRVTSTHFVNVSETSERPRSKTMNWYAVPSKINLRNHLMR